MEFGHHNIIIGQGIEISLEESYRLIVKSETIDLNATMTEREYTLIKSVWDALYELGYLTDRPIKTNKEFSRTDNAKGLEAMGSQTITGNDSTFIGHNSLFGNHDPVVVGTNAIEDQNPKTDNKTSE